MEYETNTMTKEQFEKFTDFFDANIGTDYEVNEDPEDSNKVYVVCFELDNNEVNKLRKFENEMIK